MFRFDIYSIIYDILAYMIAARSLIDEILYKLGYKRKLDMEKDLPTDLSEDVAIVTGGTRGLGLTVVRALIARGCCVHVATSQRPQLYPELEAKIYEGVKSVDPKVSLGTIYLRYLDLSSLKSVSKFIKNLKDFNATYGSHPNYLICNAGIMFAPRRITEDFLESHFAVNYLGHCLIILEFLHSLSRQKRRARVVSVSSSTHYITRFRFDDLNCESNYSASQAYAQSKLAQIMFTNILARKLGNPNVSNTKVNVYSLHPGVVLSELYEHVNLIKYFPFLIPLIKLVTRDMIQGAETILYATLSKELDYNSGVYLEDCKIKTPKLDFRAFEINESKFEDDHQKLWELTTDLLSPWLSEKAKATIKKLNSEDSQTEDKPLPD